MLQLYSMHIAISISSRCKVQGYVFDIQYMVKCYHKRRLNLGLNRLCVCLTMLCYLQNRGLSRISLYVIILAGGAVTLLQYMGRGRSREAARPVCLLMSLIRWVRAAHGGVARPNLSQICFCFSCQSHWYNLGVSVLWNVNDQTHRLQKKISQKNSSRANKFLLFFDSPILNLLKRSLVFGQR